MPLIKMRPLAPPPRRSRLVHGWATLLCAWLFAGAPLPGAAASITWTTRSTITGDADVSTNGGLLYAYDDSNLSATVNGVVFAAGNSASSLGGNVDISGYYWYNATAFGSGSGNPWNNLSSAWQSILQGGVYANSNVTMTVTLNNLTSGHAYQLQIWVNDTRVGASNRTETVTSAGGNTVTLDYNNTSANGGVGQYAIGTFMADATTQAFTLTGAQPAAGNSAQLNALQVRDLSVANGTLAANVLMTPATTYQTIYGFGGNFCQGDQKLLSGYNLYSQVFSPAGLNFSFIRLSTSYEVTNASFAGFDAANVAIITNFRALQPNGYVTLSQWSPPENLKSTASVFGGTLAKVGGQYVYTNFANWWTRVLSYYRTNAALPDYLSIQNEPDFASSGTNFQYQAGSYLNARESSTQAGYPAALAAVRSALAAAGLGTQKILGPDTTAIGGGKIQNYLTNAAPGTVDAISHHLYSDRPATTGTGGLSALDTLYPYATWPKFMTELNPFDTAETAAFTNQPDWMQLAVTIHNELVYERANAYMVWNVMYATVAYWTGQPNGTQTYYPLGHFSKFVRPGDRRASVSSSDPNLLVSLYRRTNSNPAIADVLVMVLINNDTNYVSASINTSNYWAADPLQRSWQVYKTGNDGAVQQRLTLAENLTGASLAGNRTIVLASNSIATVIINSGVYSNAPPVFTSLATNLICNPGQSLVLANAAKDPNQPAQALTFSLPLGPPGAAVNATNGLLNWRPLISQAATTNAFRMVVADNGTPGLSATQNFSVTVLPATPPLLSAPGFGQGLFGLSVGGIVGPDYIVQSSTNLSTWANRFTTNPAALPFYWSETNPATKPRQFYRVLLGP